MVRRLFQRFVEQQYRDKGRFPDIYRAVCRPSGRKWASMLKARGVLYEIGDNCSISPYCVIANPQCVRLGSNVRLAQCMIMGHDGSVNMINQAYGLKLDSVGPITIRDNVFVGQGAIILQGVVIGPNAIVGAGSVVVRNVKEGDVVSGVPAKPVGRLDMTVAILKAKNRKFPWRELIESRTSEFDPELEPQLDELRQQYFFGTKKPP